MRALGTDSSIKRGVASVRGSFPGLDRGLAADEERMFGDPGQVHGIIQPRPEELDPRVKDGVVLSASRLEALASCPLRYLHSVVLGIRSPDDPELDPDRWLNPLQRGSLLHSVFEASLRTSRADGIKPDEADFEGRALDILEERVGVFRSQVPAPGEGALNREVAGLREDVRSFVRMIRSDSADSIAFELKFGIDGDEPVVIALEGGRLRLRGAIDRVDQDLHGLHVIDYKTGKADDYGADVFGGGRHLQHAIYAKVAEERLGVEVVDGQYHFPTRKGQNQRVVYDRDEMSRLEDLLELLLDGVVRGHFVPTNDPEDCKYCDFSDICRARRGKYGKVSSPLATWAKEHTGDVVSPEFEQFQKVRSFEK
ncbi:MAG TPA: hypothetical protein DCY33_06035 [Gemmatimonadetes bacterium]|nr:hypothetical protein [Gemmatimonadota bacterium]|tara:strand:- start:367 stop:1470 length:1104 start_codon:yes stop_codon:yes gene_type:complete